MNEVIKQRLHQIGTRALCNPPTLINSYELAEKCILENIHGDFVECGVFNGSQSAAMALANQTYKQKRITHLFDSFQGIPMAGPNDDETITSCIGVPPEGQEGALISSGIDIRSRQQVIKCMREWRIDINFLKFYEGWFQYTMPKFHSVFKEKGIAVLRLDGDLYESTKVCLEYLHQYVIKGGFVIIDDYALMGCRKACDEFLLFNKVDIISIEGGGGPVYYEKQ